VTGGRKREKRSDKLTFYPFFCQTLLLFKEKLIKMDERPTNRKLRDRLHGIVFESDTYAGRLFDIVLLALIVLSVTVVILESIQSLQNRYGDLFLLLEWSFTIIFTMEYVLRLYSVKHPLGYAKSFFGIIDLLAILPTYLSIFMGGYQYLLIIRAMRLIRIFRIFKLGHFLNAGNVIMNALRASRAKIMVFIFFVLLMVLIIGAVMYVLEGSVNSDFSSIPRSIYWAIVTLTTVGYGDITPSTPLGQFFSAIVMIMGYAIIAVPTGIVSAEMVFQRKEHTSQTCPYCSRQGHDPDAQFCKYCGGDLHG